MRVVQQDPEDRDLTPVEQALTKVRLAAFSALQAGACAADVEREIAQAATAHLRARRGGGR